MKTVAHYLKPRKNGTIINKPWAPRATKALSFPPLPHEMVTFYEQHDHTYEFVLNDIVFVTGAELEKQRCCEKVRFARRVHSKQKVYTYDTTKGVVLTPEGFEETYSAFLMAHRPRWADYK